MQTFIGKSESLAQRASLSLQVHKKDKEIQEINIFLDWIEYIRLRGGGLPIMVNSIKRMFYFIETFPNDF